MGNSDADPQRKAKFNPSLAKYFARLPSKPMFSKDKQTESFDVPLFDFFSRLRLARPSTPSAEEFPSRDVDMMKVPEVQALADAIKTHSAPGIAFAPTGSDAPLGSRIGGAPAWKSGLVLPQGPDGRPLLFLAQIAVSDLPDAAPMAQGLQSGLLQFWINGHDNLMGSTFTLEDNNPDPYAADVRAGFRVIHWKDVRDLEVFAPQDEAEFTPYQWANPHKVHKALEASSFVGVPSADDFHISKFVNEALQVTAETDYDVFDADFWKPVEQGRPAVYTMGTPRFVQGDLRADEESRRFTLPLFGLGYEPGLVCVGDAGELGFWIDPEALKRGDLSRVFYTWDCY